MKTPEVYIIIYRFFSAEQGITGEDVSTDGDPVSNGPASLQGTENGTQVTMTLYLKSF